MRKRRDHRLFKKPISRNKFDLRQDDVLYTLEKAWNDLPDDVTLEERALFIELVEKLIKSYQRYRFLTNEEKSLSKN